MFLCKIYLTNYVPNIENYDSTFYEISQYEKLITKLGHLSIIPPKDEQESQKEILQQSLLFDQYLFEWASNIFNFSFMWASKL